MSNSPARFKQADLSRAIKGVTAAGLNVKRVEIESDGRILILMGNADGGDSDKKKNTFDEVLE